MKRFLLDSFLGYFFVLFLIFFFNSVTYFRVFDLFDPVSEMFEDFEITDLMMSQMREAPPADENVVLVNVGVLDRSGIAEQLKIISKYNPAVIGIDVLLGLETNAEADSALANTLLSIPNVVMAHKLLYNPAVDHFDSSLSPIPKLRPNVSLGYVNLITGASHQDDMKVCRSFTPQEKLKDTTALAFSVKLATYLNKDLTEKFLGRAKSEELINYRGNVFDYGATNYGTRYFALDVIDVLSENFVPDIIEGKAVIFCFLGNELGDRQTREDIFFTPLNRKYVGKTEPDMFGGVIHANIISMIMNEDYLDQMSENWGKFWALLLGLLNILLFTWIYKSLPNWYDGITKILQLLQVLLLVTLMIYVLHWFNYKINFSYAIIFILLAGDSIEVFHGVVKNLFSKKGRKELWKIKKIY